MLKQARPSALLDTRVTPVSLLDLKSQLRIEHSDQDQMLVQKIKAAVGDVEEYINAPIIYRSMTLTLDEFPDSIELLPSPVSSVTSLKYYDADNVQQTMDSADYELSRGYLTFSIDPADGVSWPSIATRKNAVEVIFVAGYGALAVEVPTPLIEAVTLRAATRYNVPEEAGLGNVAWSISDSLSFRSLLDPFRAVVV